MANCRVDPADSGAAVCRSKLRLRADQSDRSGFRPRFVDRARTNRDIRHLPRIHRRRHRQSGRGQRIGRRPNRRCSRDVSRYVLCRLDRPQGPEGRRLAEGNRHRRPDPPTAPGLLPEPPRGAGAHQARGRGRPLQDPQAGPPGSRSTTGGQGQDAGLAGIRRLPTGHGGPAVAGRVAAVRAGRRRRVLRPADADAGHRSGERPHRQEPDGRGRQRPHHRADLAVVPPSSGPGRSNGPLQEWRPRGPTSRFFPRSRQAPV